MKLPNFTLYEYIDAPTLNTAMGAIATSFNTAVSGIFSSPGLLRADVLGLASSGLVATVTLPAPFGIVFGGTGVLAQAHGTVTGQDTQSYSVSFSGVVPASGTVTAYLVASYAQIQQGAYQVVGPPPGNPDYNPTFVPATAYSFSVDSLAVSATTTPPDNISTYELARYALSAGAVTLPAASLGYQVKASTLPQQTPSIGFSSASGTITLTSEPTLPIVFTGAGILQLADASLSNGNVVTVVVASAGVSVVASGANLIYGVGPTPSSGVGSTGLLQGVMYQIQALNGAWQTAAGVLGTAAYQNIGFSGANVPLCNVGNVWGQAQQFSFMNLLGGGSSLSWNTSRVGFSTGTSSSVIAAIGGILGAELWCNAYQDTGGTERYIANGPAAYADLNGGNFQVFVAASGTAGSPVTFTQAFEVSNTDGGLTAGSPTGGSKGLGTLNAVALYQQGTAISSLFDAAGAAATAQSNAETFATSAASTAQSNAEVICNKRRYRRPVQRRDIRRITSCRRSGRGRSSIVSTREQFVGCRECFVGTHQSRHRLDRHGQRFVFRATITAGRWIEYRAVQSRPRRHAVVVSGHSHLHYIRGRIFDRRCGTTSRERRLEFSRICSLRYVDSNRWHRGFERDIHSEQIRWRQFPHHGWKLENDHLRVPVGAVHERYESPRAVCSSGSWS